MGVSVGPPGVSVATGVSVAGTLVSVAGTAVSVGTTAVSVGTTAVSVGVLVGGTGVLVGVSVATGVLQGPRRRTSSTYMEVSSPKPSWCTRNSIRTVCPANGVISNVWLVQADVLSHTCMMVASMLPLVSVTYASCQSKVMSLYSEDSTSRRECLHLRVL